MTMIADVQSIATLDIHRSKRWLNLQSRVLPSAVRGCVYIQSKNVKQHDEPIGYQQWPEDIGSEAHLHQVCTRAEKEKKGVVLRFQQEGTSEQATESLVHVAFPLPLGNNLWLISGFEIRPKDKQQLFLAMQQLEWGLGWLREEITIDKPTPQSTSYEEQLFAIFGNIQNTKNLSQASTILTDSLAPLYDCLRVSIGQHHKDRIELLAISHQSHIEQTSPLAVNIVHAMEECHDQSAQISFPDSLKQPGPISYQHQKLATRHGAGTIVSIPVTCTEGVGNFIVLLEKEGPEPLSIRQLQDLEKTLVTTGAGLANISLNNQSVLSIARKRLRRRKEQFFKKNKRFVILKTASLILILLIILFGKTDFRIETDATLSGTILRTIVAPFPGYVAEAFKSAGDHVSKGELLALLDTSDLTLDELSWQSKYSQAELEYRKAIADNATSQAKIIHQRKKQANIQLSLLKLQKDRAKITAPFSGSIVSGDLSQSIGGPVELGKLLFEMVPDGGFKILAQVDEKDISYIEPGQTGKLIFNSLPKDTFLFTISKVTPIATAENGSNSFRVEANLEDSSQRLNPGMTGYGKITVGTKPYIWIWTRTLRNKLRLLSWNIMP